MRWISFSRVSMQRAGVMTAVTTAASDRRPTSLEALSRSYANQIRARVAVPDASRDAMAEYIESQRLWKRYPDGVGEAVEIQDVWLSRLPSSTGAVTNDVIEEPPQLATQLRLVRTNNYTRTDRGRALMLLVPDAVAALAQSALDVNPFVLTPGVGGFFLYTFLEADYDFVRAAWEVALESASEGFTRASFSPQLADACLRLAKRWSRKIRSGEDRRRVARLNELAQEIAKPRKSGKHWGGGRPPEQTATVRIEPYVDMGLITKRDRHRYDYELTTGQRRFFESVVSTEPDDFLDQRLFGAYLDALERPRERASGEEAWERIQAAHADLRSHLGYASFKEVVLLAIGRLVDDTFGSQRTRYFEVADGVDLIKERHREEPASVRFGVTRGGGLTYVKLVPKRTR